MKKLISFKSSFSIVFIVFMSLMLFLVTLKAQDKQRMKTHYELTLRAENNLRIKIEITAIKNGKRYIKTYSTPVCIKYKSENMTIVVRKSNSGNVVDYKLACVDSKFGELYNSTVNYPNVKFEVYNGTISANRID
jgi:hypothetical protein